MSTTKNEIASNIDTRMASGSNMPISTHRGVLKDDTDDNLLDNFYPDYEIDSSVSEVFWTLSSPGSCSYNIQYTKQGRFVTVTGQITAVTTTINQLATINLPDYYAIDSSSDQYGFGFKTGDGSLVLFTIDGGSGSTTVSVSELTSGDEVSFSITYMTND